MDEKASGIIIGKKRKKAPDTPSPEKKRSKLSVNTSSTTASTLYCYNCNDVVTSDQERQECTTCHKMIIIDKEEAANYLVEQIRNKLSETVKNKENFINFKVRNLGASRNEKRKEHKPVGFFQNRSQGTCHVTPLVNYERKESVLFTTKVFDEISPLLNSVSSGKSSRAKEAKLFDLKGPPLTRSRTDEIDVILSEMYPDGGSSIGGSENNSFIEELKIQCSVLKDGECGEINNSTICKDSALSIYLSCDLHIAAADNILKGVIDNALLNNRTGTHHSDPKVPISGGCLTNYVMVVANRLITKNYVNESNQMVVIDFDIHDGDGTKSFMMSEKYSSCITYFNFYSGRDFPHADDRISFAKHSNKSYSFPFYGLVDNNSILFKFHCIIVPYLHKLNGDNLLRVIYFGCGCDVLKDGPMVKGKSDVDAECFGYMVTFCKKEFPDAKQVFSVEGAYNLYSRALTLAYALEGMKGNSISYPSGKTPPCIVSLSSDVVNLKRFKIFDDESNMPVEPPVRINFWLGSPDNVDVIVSDIQEREESEFTVTGTHATSTTASSKFNHQCLLKLADHEIRDYRIGSTNTLPLLPIHFSSGVSTTNPYKSTVQGSSRCGDSVEGSPGTISIYVNLTKSDANWLQTNADSQIKIEVDGWALFGGQITRKRKDLIGGDILSVECDDGDNFASTPQAIQSMMGNSCAALPESLNPTRTML